MRRAARDLRRGARARHARGRARAARVRGRGGADARVLPQRRARRRPTARSSPPGANACVLHYRENSAELRKGDLMLIDAGCELDSYASDITRTFPIGGALLRRAEGRLRAGARRAGSRHQGGEAGRRLRRLPRRRHARAGARASSTSSCARAASTRCSRTAPTSSSTCTAPATGWGSTCTTPATTCSKGKWRKLKPGMVLTVEPGCYIRPAPTTCPRRSGTSACASRTTCS